MKEKLDIRKNVSFSEEKKVLDNVYPLITKPMEKDLRVVYWKKDSLVHKRE